MSDEIDLLSRYRADVPDPSPRVWERARLAMSQSAQPQAPPWRARPAWRRRRWTRVLMPAVASAMAVLAVAAMLNIRLPLRQHRGAPVGWQSARPLPVTPASSASGRSGSGWRLSGYLVSRVAPLDGTLTCPDAGVCYAEGRDGAAGDVLFVTSDGAASWQVISAPAGMRFTTALSCWSLTACAAGATRGGETAAALTGDGGHTWRFERLPASAGRLSTLDCPAGTCYGLASTSRPGWYAALTNATFVTIAGTTVTDRAFPAGQMESLSCPAAGHCTALGMRGSQPAGEVPRPGAVEVTTDGGITWHAGVLPGDYDDAGSLSALDCPDSTHCWATGMYGMQGYAILSSADSGRTWHYRRQVTANSHLPVGDVLACPSASVCELAGGWPDWGRKIGGTTYNNLAMLTTGDAGARWKVTTFAVPAHLQPGADPDSYVSVASLQCPAVTFCVGLGSQAPGSAADTIYTFGHDHGP